MSRERSGALAQVNLLLVVLIVSINGYILLSPLLPQLELWMRQRRSSSVAGLPYKTQLSSDNKDERNPVPKDNRLVIPTIALDEHVYVGTDPHLVNRGVWARPQTSIPPEGSNTVLVGHRFTYDGPASFYSLDKLTVGDSIVLYWQGKEYDYRVSLKEVVPPTAVNIEHPTKQPQLTLYTCTPIWSAKDRLVIIAKPISQEVDNE